MPNSDKQYLNKSELFSCVLGNFPWYMGNEEKVILEECLFSVGKYLLQVNIYAVLMSLLLSLSWYMPRGLDPCSLQVEFVCSSVSKNL